MAVEVADLLVSLRSEDLGFGRMMGAADKAFNDLTGHSHSAMAAVGGLTLGLAGLAVGGLAMSVKSAIDFNTMMNQLQNNTTLTNADMVTLRSGILSMATQTSAPLSQLAAGIQHITNFGYGAKDAMVILNEAMMSATSTGGDTGATAEMLANVMHEFNIKTKDAGHAMDVLHLASAQGNTTLEQFTVTSGKAMAMAANLGVPLNETAAALAALTRHGLSAAASSTLVAGLLSKIINPAKSTTKELALLSHQTGVNLSYDFTTAGLKAKGLGQVLTDLATVSKMTGVNVLQLVPATRGGLAAMILTGTGTRDYNQILLSLNDTFRGKITPTLDAFRRTQQTLGFQLGQLSNLLQVLGITIGTALIPPILQLVTWVTGIVLAFKDWVTHSKLVQDAIAFVRQKIADALPYLAQFKDWVVTTVTEFAKWVASHKQVTDAIGAIAKGLLLFAAGSLAYKAVLATIGVLVELGLFFTGKTALGIALRLFAVAWANNWGDIQGTIKAAWVVIHPILDALKTFFDTPLGYGIIGSVLALGAALFVVASAMKAIEAAQGAIAIIKGLGGLIGIGGGSGGGGGTTGPGAGADAATRALTAAITSNFPSLTTAITAHIVDLKTSIDTHVSALTAELKAFIIPFPASIPLTVPALPAVGLNDANLLTAISDLTTTIKTWKPTPGPAGAAGAAGTLSSPDVKALTSAITSYFLPLNTAISTYFDPLTKAINAWKPSTGGHGGTITGALGLTTAIESLSLHVVALDTTISHWKPTAGGGGGHGPTGPATASTMKLDATALTALNNVHAAINQSMPPLTTAINSHFPSLITALGHIKIELSGTIKGLGDLSKPILVPVDVAASALRATALKVAGWLTPAGDMGRAVATGAKALATLLGSTLSDVNAWGLVMGAKFTAWARTHALDFVPGVKVVAIVAGKALSAMNNWGLTIESTFTAWCRANANALKTGVGILTAQIGAWVSEAWNKSLKIISTIDLKGVVNTAIDGAGPGIKQHAGSDGGLTGAITDWISGAMGAMGKGLGLAGSGIKDTVIGAMKIAHDAISLVAGSVTDPAGLAGATVGWVNGAMRTLSSALTNVTSGVQATIVGAFKGANTWLYTIGRDLIDGLMNGITSHLSDLKTFLGDLKGKIIGWKGPPSADRVLLVDNGALIMRGLIAGMQTQLPNLQGYLASVSTAIAVRAPGGTGASSVGYSAGSGGNLAIGNANQPSTLHLQVVMANGQVLYNAVMDIMGRNQTRRVELGGI